MQTKNDLKRLSQERIKELAKRFESQQEFADFCGISKFSISQYVNGSNSPGNVNAARIARAFDINPLWIMGFDVPEQTEEQQARYERIKNAAEYLAKNQSHREALNITVDEWQLISAFRYLNKAGQEKALIDVIDLTEIEKYRKDEYEEGYIRT